MFCGVHLESTTEARPSSGAASIGLVDVEEPIVTLAGTEVAAPEDGRTPPSRREMVVVSKCTLVLRLYFMLSRVAASNRNSTFVAAGLSP